MNKQQIHGKMIEVMREVEAVGKIQKNVSQGFNYRGIDDVYNALHTAMAKHGIFCMPGVVSKERQERTNAKGTIIAFTMLRMEYRFYADDGSFVSCTVEGEGMDSGDKSSNKAMAVAHKYALLQAFMIPTEDQKDPDADTHDVKPKPGPEYISADQVANLQALITEVAANKLQFLAHIRCNSLETILATNYQRVVGSLEAKRSVAA